MTPISHGGGARLDTNHPKAAIPAVTCRHRLVREYYGAYPGPMAPSTSTWAIASLMCSLAGWFLVPVLGSVLGVIFGHIALGEIKRSDGRLEGRGMAIAGLIIGYAMLAFAVCVIAVAIAVIANGVGNPSFPTQ